mgnify:CR=1 FL=1
MIIVMSPKASQQEIDNALKNPVFIGFGIKNKSDFENVTEKAQGGIIGTAFVKILLDNEDWEANIVILKYLLSGCPNIKALTDAPGYIE